MKNSNLTKNGKPRIKCLNVNQLEDLKVKSQRKRDKSKIQSRINYLTSK